MALSSRVLLIRAPWDHNHLLSRKMGLYHAIYTQKPLQLLFRPQDKSHKLISALLPDSPCSAISKAHEIYNKKPALRPPPFPVVAGANE